MIWSRFLFHSNIQTMKRSVFFLFWLAIHFTSAEAAIKIAVVSDIHFLSEKLVDGGEAYQAYLQSTGRDIGELHLILDQVLDEIIRETPDVLLISGDLANHGERQSHTGLIRKLERVKNAGISVFVVPGNHDVNVPDSKAYIGRKSLPVPSVSKDEFAVLYNRFGFEDAIFKDESSLSYCAELGGDHWLLAFDSNRYAEHAASSITSGRILPETMEWALNILHEAKEKGKTVLGMMHHGLVEHMPYQSAFFSDYLIDDWKQQAETLADAGLKVVFTGHFHANDITMFTSAQGNRLYDIETGSLAQYPFPYRLITLEDDELNINSHFVDSVSGLENIQANYLEKMKEISKRAISSKINRLGMTVSAEVRRSLIDLLVQMSVLHVAGDEETDSEMLRLIGEFAATIGDDDFDADGFSLDFPPSDNNLTIRLK